MRKPAFCICENKGADQLRAFVFATQIVQSLYYLNPKFQASSHLLWLYSPVCVGPGQKPRTTVFSQRGSYVYVSHKLPADLVQSALCLYRHHASFACFTNVMIFTACYEKKYVKLSVYDIQIVQQLFFLMSYTICCL